MGDISGGLNLLIWVGAIIIGCLWGCWELVDWLFITESIESAEPITPTIKLVISENVVDTIYIYTKP